MKVVMTRAELDSHIANYPMESLREDTLLLPNPEIPLGWCVYVRLNHCDKIIPIELEEG